MMSLKEKFGYLKGLKIGIVGDILHSRVARSNIYGLTTMGAEVKVCGPPNLIPRNIKELGADITHNIDNLMEWADALNILRIQKKGWGCPLSHLLENIDQILSNVRSFKSTQKRDCDHAPWSNESWS